MAQPAGQVLVDSGHAWAGPLWYAHDTGGGGANDAGLWNALDGIMESKTGTGAVSTEGGAKVINSAGTTYFTLASTVNVNNGQTLFVRSRTTANNTASIVAGDRTATNNMVWTNNGSARLAIRRSSTGNIEGVIASSTVMKTVHLVFNSNNTVTMYTDGGSPVTMSGTSASNLVIKHLLAGYSGGSFSLNGALECIGVIPAALTAGEVATHAADLYQTLAAPAGDTTAPVLSSVTASAADAWSVVGSVTTDEAGPAWAVLTGSATTPTAAQIKAGQDHTGAAAVGADADTLSAGANALVFDFVGLTPETTYYMHVVQDDVATPANTSIPVTSAAVTTDAAPTDTITLTSPVYCQSKQRDLATGLSREPFTVAGSYTGAPLAIEGRFASGPWATLVAEPTGGTFSTTVYLPLGQGAFEVRFSDNPTVTDSVELVTVGDGFAAAGQSNPCGRASGVVPPVPGAFTATKLGRDGVWKPLTEANTQVGSFDEATSAAGSYHGALSNLLQAQGVPVFFIPCALGGVSISDWARYAPDPSDPYLLYGDVFQAWIACGGLRGVIYYQGETDAANGASQASYTTALNTLVNNWWMDLGVETFIVKICRWNSSIYGQIDAIRAAQQDVINNNPHAAGGADANVWTSGNVHYNTTTEVQAVADAIYAGMVTAFYTELTPVDSTISLSRSVRTYVTGTTSAARSIRSFASASAVVARSVLAYASASASVARSIAAAGVATAAATVARSVRGYASTSVSLARSISATTVVTASLTVSRRIGSYASATSVIRRSVLADSYVTASFTIARSIDGIATDLTPAEMRDLYSRVQALQADMALMSTRLARVEVYSAVSAASAG